MDEEFHILSSGSGDIDGRLSMPRMAWNILLLFSAQGSQTFQPNPHIMQSSASVWNVASPEILVSWNLNSETDSPMCKYAQKWI